jgi:hypothetical protein
MARQARDEARSGPRSARGRTVALKLAVALLGTLWLSLSLSLCAGALASSGTALDVATPDAVRNVDVAVDDGGEAVVVWADDKDLGGSGDVVQYCVMPTGASACRYAGSLTPAGGGAPHVYEAQVLVEKGTIVVLADVVGAVSRQYEPVQEWQSGNGGASFTSVDGGRSVADGTLSGDTEPIAAVELPGSGELGYGWDSASGGEAFGARFEAVPTFAAFALNAPPECSVVTCGEGSGVPFAALQPNSDANVLHGEPGSFASQAGPNPGVLGVFQTNFTSGPLGCAGGYGSAFAWGTGTQSTSNSYGISPGSTDSAWHTSLTSQACGVSAPAAGGGVSGFGVLEQQLGAGRVIYERLDEVTGAFDLPAVTVDWGEGESDATLSQDGAGGIYATYLGGGKGGPIKLAYSNRAGTLWIGPETLAPDSDQGAEDLTSSVDAAGQGWAAWFDAGAIYVQQFVASDALPAPAPDMLAAIQASGAKRGSNISILTGTVGESDSAKITGPNAAGASGTITYTLYRAQTCNAATAVYSSPAETVSGGVAPPSSPLTTVLSPGTYYWLASYSGDPGTLSEGGNLPGNSGCMSETLTVTPRARIGAQASSSAGKLTITVACLVVPCTFTATVTATTSSRSGGRKRGSHTRTITLATGRFTVGRHGARRLTLRLTAAGRGYLTGRSGASARIVLSQRLRGQVVRTGAGVVVRRG